MVSDGLETVCCPVCGAVKAFVDVLGVADKLLYLDTRDFVEIRARRL